MRGCEASITRGGHQGGDVPAASQLEQVTDAVAAERSRTQLTFVLGFAPVSAQKALAQQLAVADATSPAETAKVASTLSPSLAPRWQRLLAAPETVQSQKYSEKFAITPPRFTTINADILKAARVAILSSTAFSAFLRETVAEGTRVATSDASRASTQATLTIVGSIGALAATILVLMLVGTAIRRRLGALAAAAHSFSSGTLATVTIRGPREVATASVALNDAVAGLRQVQHQADLLARGELDSADLEQRVDGPLGAAIHESVERLVNATRDQEAMRRELAHQATHDTLTGLPNRPRRPTCWTAHSRPATAPPGS